MPQRSFVRSLATATLLLSAFTAASASAAIRVAVEQGAAATAGNGTGQAVVNQLNDDTYFDFTATLVDATQIDTAPELANYDVVIFGDTGNNNADWTPAMAAALKAAVSAGKLGVVSTGWADYATGNGGDPTRDSDLDEVMPIDAYPFQYGFCGGPNTINGLSPTHPITAGVASFVTNSGDIEGVTTGSDAANGVVLGSSACGRQVVIAGNYGAGRIVYLGLLYMANSSYGVTDLRTGNADRLLEQAVHWAVSNQQPIANAKTVTTNEDTAVAFTLTGSDPENQPITFAIATPPAKGVLSGTAPNLTYTPNPNANGTDTFTFTVNDGQLTSAPATVTINVTPVNDPPVAQPLSVGTAEDVAKAITLSGSDPDGNPLTFTIATQPSNGTLSGTAPNVTYTPAPNFNGSDSFTFTVSDGTATSAAALVTIAVTPVNDPPVAVAQTLSLAEDTQSAVALSATDVDGDPLMFAIATQPANGSLSGTPPNLTYTPAPNFNGTDSFSFTASDGASTSAPATVTLNVTPVNDAPVAVAQTVTVNEDGMVAITLSAVDPDGDPLTFTVTSVPVSGALTGMAPSLSYAPNPNFNGQDAFTFTVSDGSLSSTATITLDVTPVNDAPVALDQSFSVNQGESSPLPLVATDVDGDPLNVTVTTPPTHGTLSGTGLNVTYTPDTAYHGPDSFVFVVDDGQASATPATATITVKNLAPMLTVMSNALTPLQGELVQFTAMVLDPGGDPVTVTWDFGDGATAMGTSATHAFATGGTFTVTATASDGDLSTTKTISLNVQDGSPVIGGIQGPDMGDEGALLDFAATATDPAGGALTYQWSWGDLSDPSSGQMASHAFGDNGTYEVTLTVTDIAGFSSTSKRMVTIKNLPPVATQPAEQTATVGKQLTFKLAATDAAGANDPLTWTMVDGVGAVTESGDWTWTPSASETPGRFNVVVRVSDGDEGTTDVPFVVNLVADGNGNGGDGNGDGSVAATGCGCAAQAGAGGGLAWAFVFAAALSLGWRRRVR